TSIRVGNRLLMMSVPVQIRIEIPSCTCRAAKCWFFGITRSAVTKAKASLWNRRPRSEMDEAPVFLAIVWAVVGEAMTFWPAPVVTIDGEMLMLVPEEATSAVTTNCCKTPVSALVSGWQRLQPTKVITSPFLSVLDEPLVTVTEE